MQVGADTARLVTTHFQGYGLDETLLNWLLTVLIVGFMFCAGLVIVNFPWMFMGEITCEYCVEVSRFHESFYNIRTLVEVFSEYCEYFPKFRWHLHRAARAEQPPYRQHQHQS